MGQKRTDARSAWAMFCGVPEDNAAAMELADACHFKTYSNSETMIRQDEPDKDVYLILQGRLRAVKYSRNGHEIWLSNIEPGELVGELGCLNGGNRTSSVIVESDSSALAISSQRFLSLMDLYPELSLAISRLLAKRLSLTSDKLTELTALPVSIRLHQELQRSGIPDPEDSELTIVASPPTISELARRIHTSRETASRAFGSLEHQGLLKRTNGEVLVINPNFS
jgi:CRP/FNR family transcriptional regulator, cyclic AMP receptor protein